MAIGEKLTPEAKAELLDRLRAKYADDHRAGELADHDSPTGESPDGRWHDLGAHEDTDDTPPGARGLDTLRRFFELLEAERPAWQADALCLEYPDVAFFPEQGESTEPAKDICARCPCAAECRAWAIETDAKDGIWAGENARKIKRSRAA